MSLVANLPRRVCVMLVVALCALACTPAAPAVPNASPSTTPTPAPTPKPVALRESFDRAETKTLRTGTTSNASFAIVDKAYQITVAKPNTFVWSTFGGAFSDGTIRVDVAFHESAHPTAAGIIFRMRDEQNFYMFSISNDGYYALDARENGQWRSVVEWTSWPTIDSRGVFNHVRVEARGDTFSLYVNDKLMGQAVDQAFSTGGMALAVNTYEQAEGAVLFDSLVVTPES